MVILILIGTFQLRTIKIENKKNIILRLRLGKIIFLVLYLKHSVVKAEIEVLKTSKQAEVPLCRNARI